MRLSLTFILLALLLAGCKGSAGPEALSPEQEGDRPWSPTEAGAEDHTPYPELHDFLMDELERLGKDPSRSTSAVATGNANRVFDLKPTLIDPDGPGGEPPVAVTLSWSEVLVGDYDQNGLVNASDLTPLGQNYLKSVEYDDAVLHGGFAFWPSGDPTDDGGVTPPASDSPAANWRRARIDGDRNSLLNQADITPIAVHWQEALSGYRIYRQAPGETEFTILPGQPGTSDGLSVDHPSAPGNAPVLYGFEDDNTAASGIYLYYVASYDLQSQEQGPASGIVSIDLDTGMVNSSPVASLTVTPDFAGAPAEITLDATGSYDPDGSIAAYEWDFDGDGTIDWLSTDPLPETSSDGTVNSFEIVEPGVVKATYRQGSDDYFQPLVRAIDDMAAQSNPADAHLGISGWDYDILNASVADYKLPIVVEAMSVDPITDEIVAAGYTRTSTQSAGVLEPGIYFARRAYNGDWSYEKVPVSDIGTNIAKGKVIGIVREICWDSDSNPTILLLRRVEGGLGVTDPDRLWRCTRMQNGSWKSIKVIVMGESGEESSSKMLSDLDTKTLPDGSIVSILIETLDDKGSLNGASFHFRFHIMHNLNGTWQTEYTGNDTAEINSEPRRLLAMPDGTVFALFDQSNPAPGLPTGVPAAIWTPGEGLGDPFSLEGGQVELEGKYQLETTYTAADGTAFITYEFRFNPEPDKRALVSIKNGMANLQIMSDPVKPESPPRIDYFVEGIGGTKMCIQHIGASNTYIEVNEPNGNNSTKEIVFPRLVGDLNAIQGAKGMAVNRNKRSYIIAKMDDHDNLPDTEFSNLYLLFRHLDPRLKGL